MRNRQRPVRIARRARRFLRGIVAAGLAALVASCTTVIEDDDYEGLALGVTKDEVLERLDALPMVHQVQPALPRNAGEQRASRSVEPEIVRLAAAAVGAGTLSDAERQYLLTYDRWYFEEADGERAVLLTFGDGVLAEIRNRREGNWLEALF